MKLYQTFIFKFFIFGLAALIIIECGMMFFVGDVYLADRDNYTKQKVTGQQVGDIKKASCDAEDGVDNYYASYDGKYIAYEKDDSITIENMDNHEKKTVEANNGMKIECFKWIYDRDRIIIAEKRRSGSYFKLYTYDMGDDSANEVMDAVDNKTIKIQTEDSHEKVDQIEMSTLTSLIYIKITGEEESRLYGINIMAQKSQIGMPTHHIGNFGLLKNDDIIFYENTYNNKVYDSSTKKSVRIDGKSNFKPLSVDNNDSSYLASVENDKVNTIYYGDDLLSMWKTINLTNPADIKDIYVTGNGDIYRNDSSSSTLTNLKTNKQINYKGSIKGVYDFGYITQDGNKIVREPIK